MMELHRKSLLMRFFSIVLAMVLVSGFLSAQEQSEGHIRYLVIHNWTKKQNSLDYISKQRRERSEYMWGNDSEWKVYTELWFSPAASRYEDSEERAEVEDMGYSWRKEVYSIRRDFKAGIQHDNIEMLGKTYLIEDSLRCQDWKVLNDIKEVAGHVCMNATWRDTLKQQTIIAWFALDLPVSAGPERLCGLPGLILEANVNDGALLISADKIEMNPVGTALELPKKLKGKKLSEAEYQAIIQKQIAEKKKEEQPWFWGMRY